MMKHMLALLLVIFPASAWAGEEEVDGLSPEMRKEICRSYVTHIPRDDVEYKPGVTRDGWVIPPADLQEPITIMDDITINLDMPLLPHVPQAAGINADLSEMRIHAGTLTIRKGQVYYNGKPLGEDRKAIKALCGSQ